MTLPFPFALVAPIILCLACSTKSRNEPTIHQISGSESALPGFWPPRKGLPCERFDEKLFRSSEAVPEAQFLEAIGCALERCSDDQMPSLLHALNNNFQAESDGRYFRYFHSGLGPGTTFGGLHFSNTKGHIDASEAVLRELSESFSDDARTIMADASQDADLFEWKVMAAHGQTMDDHGQPLDAEMSKSAWVAWLRTHVDWVASHCRAEPVAAVYRFGYALHALEDVAPHKGRTNPEHSFNAHEGKNPDEEPDSYRLAIDMTTQFVRAQLSGRLADCVPVFRTVQGEKPSFSKKKIILGRERDFTVASLIDYRQSWALHESATKHGASPVRWFAAAHNVVSCDQDPACVVLLQRLQ